MDAPSPPAEAPRPGFVIVALKACLGLLVAPLAPGFVVMVASVFSGAPDAFGFVVTIVITYPVAVIVGLPTHALLKWIHRVKWWHYTIAGCLGGMLAWIGFARSILRDNLIFAGILGVMGGLTAMTFWVLARPDLDRR